MVRNGRTYLKPSRVRFMQDSIAGRFQNGGFVEEAIVRILQRRLQPEDFPVINVVEMDGKMYSCDNRRLYVFRAVEYERGDIEIPVNIVPQSGLHCSKFTTMNHGRTVRVRQGPQRRHWRDSWEAKDLGQMSKDLSPQQPPPQYLQTYSGLSNQSYVPDSKVDTSAQAESAVVPHGDPAISVAEISIPRPNGTPPTILMHSSTLAESQSRLPSLIGCVEDEPSRPTITPQPITIPQTPEGSGVEVPRGGANVNAENEGRDTTVPTESEARTKGCFRKFLGCLCCCCFARKSRKVRSVQTEIQTPQSQHSS